MPLSMSTAPSSTSHFRRSTVVPVGIDQLASRKSGLDKPMASRASSLWQPPPRSQFRVERIPLLPDQLLCYYGLDDEEEDEENSGESQMAESPRSIVKDAGRRSTLNDTKLTAKNHRSSVPSKESVESIPSFRFTFNNKAKNQRVSTVSTADKSCCNGDAPHNNNRSSRTSGGSTPIPSFHLSLPNSIFQSTVGESILAMGRDAQSRRTSRDSVGNSVHSNSSSSAPSTPASTRQARPSTTLTRSLNNKVNRRTQTMDRHDNMLYPIQQGEPTLPNFSFKPSNHNGTNLPPTTPSANRTAISETEADQSVIPSFRLSIGNASWYQSTIYNATQLTMASCKKGISAAMLEAADSMSEGPDATQISNSTATSTPVRAQSRNQTARTDAADFNDNWDEGLLTPESERRRHSKEIAEATRDGSYCSDDIAFPADISPIKRAGPIMEPENSKQPQMVLLENREPKKLLTSTMASVRQAAPSSTAVAATASGPQAPAPLKSALKQTSMPGTAINGALKELCLNYGSPSSPTAIEEAQLNRRRSRVSFYDRMHKGDASVRSDITTTTDAHPFSSKPPQSPSTSSPPAKSSRQQNQVAAMSPPTKAGGNNVGSRPSPLASQCSTSPLSTTSSPTSKKQRVGGRVPNLSMEKLIHMNTLIRKAARISISDDGGKSCSSPSTATPGSSPKSSIRNSPASSTSPRPGLPEWMPKSGKIDRRAQPRSTMGGARGKDAYPDHLFTRKPAKENPKVPSLFDTRQEGKAPADNTDDDSFGRLSEVSSCDSQRDGHGAGGGMPRRSLVPGDATWYNYGSDRDEGDDVEMVDDAPSPALSCTREKETRGAELPGEDDEFAAFAQRESIASDGGTTSNSGSDTTFSNTSVQHIVIAASKNEDPSLEFVVKEPKIVCNDPNSPSITCLGLRRSERRRLPRLLNAYGQKPIYKEDMEGNLHLVGVEDAVVKNKLLTKHRVVDTVVAEDKERKSKNSRRAEKKLIAESRKRRLAGKDWQS